LYVWVTTIGCFSDRRRDIWVTKMKRYA